MVIGVAALLQIVEVIDTILIVGHGVAHIGLLDAIHSGQEVQAIFISGFLASRCFHGSKILILNVLGEGFADGSVPACKEDAVFRYFIFGEIPHLGQAIIPEPAQKYISIPAGVGGCFAFLSG